MHVLSVRAQNYVRKQFNTIVPHKIQTLQKWLMSLLNQVLLKYTISIYFSSGMYYF